MLIEYLSDDYKHAHKECQAKLLTECDAARYIQRFPNGKVVVLFDTCNVYRDEYPEFSEEEYAYMCAGEYL